MTSEIKIQKPPAPGEVLLRFRCHRCGNCCRGTGHVFLEEDDLPRLAAYLNLSVEEFQEQCTETIESGALVLKDQNDPERSCVFLKEDSCSVHSAKPKQCREFPNRWRPATIETYCEGWRAALGLPPLGRRGRHGG